MKRKTENTLVGIYLFLIVACTWGAMLNVGCNEAGKVPEQIKKDSLTELRQDTGFVPVLTPDSVVTGGVILTDSALYYRRKYDSVVFIADTLRLRLRETAIKLKDANFKITKTQYYLKVVDANPGNLKYLKGWIRNRALAD